MTKKAIANKLNGMEYRNDIPKDVIQLAKDNNLVIIFGYSDDLVELEGAVYDELNAWGGTTFLLSKDGLVERPNIDDYEDDDFDERYSKYLQLKANGQKISANYGGKGNLGWWFDTKIPHVTFDVTDPEDDEDYIQCRGMVIDLKEL